MTSDPLDPPAPPHSFPTRPVSDLKHGSLRHRVGDEAPPRIPRPRKLATSGRGAFVEGRGVRRSKPPAVSSLRSPPRPSSPRQGLSRPQLSWLLRAEE